MLYKDLLLPLITYPSATPVSAVDEAIDITAAIGAKLSAIACAIDFRMPGTILGSAFPDVPNMAATVRSKSAQNAETLLDAFEDSATRRGIFQERVLEHSLASCVSDVFVDYARLRDLTIFSVSDGAIFDQPYAEAILFGSGRPAMIIPDAPRRTGRFALDTVVIAWDFSRPAARAVADALPILAAAAQVYVVMVTSEKNFDTRRSGVDLARHLAHHGIEVTLNAIDAEGRKIGDVLEAYVAAHDADLLVMGAYGHSRLREFILGGATRSMISQPPLPLFLSH